MTPSTDHSTIRLAETVYGGERDPADPAELLHEASKLQPSTIGRQMRGVARLTGNPRLLATTSRAVRRNHSLEILPLPPSESLDRPLSGLLCGRRSVRDFAPQPLARGDVATLLHAAYGVTAPAANYLPPRRAVPSAGALFPLELFMLARRVDDLPAGVYHYDPLRHVLGRHRHADGRVAAAADDVFTNPTETASAALVLVVAAVFWRSRVKYGLRAYRFTLLEAGHVVQNVALAVECLGLGGFLVGGFFDARLDALLGLDGVDESSLIAVCIGRRA